MATSGNLNLLNQRSIAEIIFQLFRNLNFLILNNFLNLFFTVVEFLSLQVKLDQVFKMFIMNLVIISFYQLMNELLFCLLVEDLVILPPLEEKLHHYQCVCVKFFQSLIIFLRRNFFCYIKIKFLKNLKQSFVHIFVIQTKQFLVLAFQILSQVQISLNMYIFIF